MYTNNQKDNIVYYDLNTQNKSFCDVSNELKIRGVKNHKFPLILYNSRLSGVDPFDEGLDPLTKCEIINECRRNPWYYLREVVKIQIPGNKYIPYIANKLNITQAWCILNNLDSWLCKTKESNSTISILALLSWFCLFGNNTRIGLIGEYLADSLVMRQRLNNMINNIPRYINQNNIQNVIKAKSFKAFDITELDNESFIRKELHFHIHYFDGAAFVNYIDILVNKSKNAYKLINKKYIGPHSRIFTSFDCDNNEGLKKMIERKIFSKTITWLDEFYDIPIENFITRPGARHNGIILIRFNNQ